MNVVKSYLVVTMLLLALLLLTVGAAYVHLGPLNTPMAMGIALAKAALIAVFFMDLRRASSLTRLFAAAGVFWLAIMLGLTLQDYLTR